MKHQKFSIYERIRSFKFAFHGLKILIHREHNARIHLTAAIGVIILGFLFQISNNEWLAVILAIGFVIGAEIFNSCVEKILDFITLEQNSTIGKIKDLAAAGVLISTISSLIIGSIIFIPKGIAFIGNF